MDLALASLLNGMNAMSTKTSNPMSVYQAIYGRRSAWKFSDAPVDRMAIERMLDAAVWAPNHRLTEPWRFFVLEQDSPERLKAAELAYEFQLERTSEERRAEAAKRKVLEPPVVMYVYTIPGPNDETTRENYASVCIAAHNISLAGADEGLAVTWETGGVTRHPELKALLGADESWEMATMLLIDYPGEHPVSRRSPASGFVRWFGAYGEIR
ncbi:MAG: hypothetical protein F4X27_01055 [Chloroflexi bacterium]|nr:hypothetical protein [Chloroflexota bacterium]